MQAYQVIEGGRARRAAAAGAQAAALGQTHTGVSSVTASDVTSELQNRGYRVAVHVPVVEHEPVIGPTLTKSMAISVAIDEALAGMKLPHTTAHPYRCPTAGCPIPANQWNGMVNWCVTVANGYLTNTYGLPSWASSALHSGALRGLSGLGSAGLGSLADWVRDNGWLVSAVGSTISAYGTHLTAEEMKRAINEAGAKSLTKEDAMNLFAALKQQGAILPGQAEAVAAGANMATASPGWMVPAMIGVGVLVVVMMMKK